MRNGKRMRHSKWQKLDWAIDIKDQMWKCAEMNLHTGMALGVFPTDFYLVLSYV